MHVIFLSTTSGGGLVVKELISILGVQGSILMNGVGCGQCWNVN
jgi:hypothetical protein